VTPDIQQTKILGERYYSFAHSVLCFVVDRILRSLSAFVPTEVVYICLVLIFEVSSSHCSVLSL
jgi:hypothetical protein